MGVYQITWWLGFVVWLAQLAGLVPNANAQVDFVVLTANWHEERRQVAHEFCQLLHADNLNCTAFPAWRGSEIEESVTQFWEDQGMLIPGAISERRFKFSQDPNELEQVNSTIRLNSIASGMGHATIVVSWLKTPVNERSQYLVVVEDDQMVAQRWAIQRMAKPAKIASSFDLVNLSRCPAWSCKLLSSNAVVPWTWPWPGKFTYVEATLYTRQGANKVYSNLPLRENYDVYLRRLHRTGHLNPGCTCAHLFQAKGQVGRSIRGQAKRKK